MIIYEIRHLQIGLKKNTLEVLEVYSGEENKNFAQRIYKDYSNDYPNDYFELVEIDHKEKCLNFTVRKP